MLGSGGAKGLVHIGVIAHLTSLGLDIRYISGSSVGALVGGTFAAGELDTLEDWVCSLQKSDVVRLLDWSFGRGSLFKGERIIQALKEVIGDHEIGSLPVGFTAVATDISRIGGNREIWFSDGPLFDAVRASIAVPTIFAPVRLNDRLLVDGGVINPVPVGPTLNQPNDLTIAIDLGGAAEGVTRLPVTETTPAPRYQQKIKGFIDKFWPEPDKPEHSFAAYDIGLRSMEVMQASITQFRLAASPPDIIVSVPGDICGFFDFHRARDLIQYGKQIAEDAISTAAVLPSRASGENDP